MEVRSTIFAMRYCRSIIRILSVVRIYVHDPRVNSVHMESLKCFKSLASGRLTWTGPISRANLDGEQDIASKRLLSDWTVPR